jgi:hypothetical protein
MNTEKIKREMKRWLLNDRKSSLHQRINNRGIMFKGHYMVLGLKIPKLSKLQKGESKQLAYQMWRDTNNPMYFRKGCLDHYHHLKFNFYKK